MSKSKKRAPWALKAAAAFAAIFGSLSIISGGTVLYGGDEAQRAAGAYVDFVVWSNFLGGFAYVAAGAGMWMRQRWAAPLALLIAAATLLVFIAFGLHVAGGATYETRTVAAMSFRLVVWLVISLIAYRCINRSN